MGMVADGGEEMTMFYLYKAVYVFLWRWFYGLHFHDRLARIVEGRATLQAEASAATTPPSL